MNYTMKSAKRNLKSNSPSGKKINKKESVNQLRTIMARLRGPAGCPWDRIQSENTLKKYVLEEAYEDGRSEDIHETAPERAGKV